MTKKTELIQLKFIVITILMVVSLLGCDSLFKQISQGTSDIELLPSPYSFKATAGEKKVDLTWKVPTYSVDVNVQLVVSTTGYPTTHNDGQVIYQGAAESSTHLNLTDNQTYFFSLFTFTASQYSVPVNAKATPSDKTSPGLVEQVSATARTSGVLLEWKNPVGFESTDLVNVLVSTQNFPVTPNVSEQLLYSGTGETLTHSSLENDQEYYYCIFTKDNLDNYSQPKKAIATPKDVTGPSPVSGVGVSTTTNAVTLTWTNPKDKDFLGVMIRRSTTSWPVNTTQGEKLYLGAQQRYIDYKLTPNTIYYYGFFAQDKLGNWSIPLTTSGKTVSN